MISRKIFVVALASAMVISAAGCNRSGKEKPSQTSGNTNQTTIETTTTQTKATSTSANPSEPQELYVTINGTDLRVGMEFLDVKSSLGAPVSERRAFDEGNVYGGVYSYSFGDENLEITTGPEDKIRQIDFYGKPGASSCILNGKIKIGDSFEDLKALFGIPKAESKEEDIEQIMYQFGDISLMIQITGNSIQRITLIG